MCEPVSVTKTVNIKSGVSVNMCAGGAVGTSAPEADAAESLDDLISLSVPTPRSLRRLSPAATHTGVPKGAPGTRAPPSGRAGAESQARSTEPLKHQRH